MGISMGRHLVVRTAVSGCGGVLLVVRAVLVAVSWRHTPHHGVGVVSAWTTTTTTTASGRHRAVGLPDTLLIGYATDSTPAVAQAVREGVNVVVWSFLDLRRCDMCNQSGDTQGTAHKDNDDDDDHRSNSTVPHARTTIDVRLNSLDLDKIRNMIATLDAEGYDDTVHLVSMGGWNGPHLDPQLLSPPDEWYNAWKQAVGDVFHGIDWDLEGHDDLASPTNTFTVDCLDAMGTISQLAHRDGYIVGMAPPQSYLDVSSSTFSRQVNRTDPHRSWHADFSYFGANVYAYLLARYGASIDFCAIQFYESYSRAGMSIHHDGMAPDVYLVDYIKNLVEQKESFWVDFGQDPTIDFPSQRVSLPVSKLVFGFANGWALDNGEKTVFVTPEHIQRAYDSLRDAGQAPRGCMFWVIGEEGTRGVQYGRDLNSFLHIRDTVRDKINDLKPPMNDEL